MLKKYTYFLLTTFVVLIAISCHNDVGDINPQSEQSNVISNPPFNIEEVTGDLVGFIYDETNTAVAGASVHIYSAETTTDEFGMFNFNNAKLDPQGTFITAEKEGFIIGSDLVYPNSNGKGTSRILMLSILNDPAFQSSEGGVVEIIGGGSITFPPFSLIRPNGSIYDGEVKSTAYRLSPGDHELGSKMSGGLLGIDEKGRHRVLSTFGILAIELRSFDDQILRMKSDKTAELSLPVDDDLQALINNEAAAWSFDFQDGVWKEKLSTTNDQENYFTTIDALGFWNIAIHNEISQVCGRLLYSNELPAKNYIIQIENNGLLSRIGITDQDGYFCGKLPKGENLTLQILHPTCGDLLKELVIGEFEEVGTIGDMILEVDEKYVFGKVECSGLGINDATVITSSNGETNFFYPNANGSFNINIQEVVCGPSSDFTVFAYHNSTGMSSEVLSLNTEVSESITLEVCQIECLAAGAFLYEKEDYCESGQYNRVILEVSHGSGEYAYEWDDGSTDVYFNNPSPGELCVKVTDIITGCEYEFCDMVESYERINVKSIYSSNTECFLTSGFANLEITGGRGEIEYEWIGPDSYFSDSQNIEGLPPGTYTVTVRDEEGCEISESVEVFDVTIPIELSKEDFCAVSIITIEEFDGYKPYTYTWNESDAEVNGNQLFVYSPGMYNVTMTDANSCTRSTSLNISSVGFLPELNPEYECDGGVITFSNVEAEYDYFYQSFGSSDVIPLEVVNSRIEVLILESGYGFELSSNNPNYNDCSVSEEIELPRFEGLVVGEVTDPSCDSCEDGHIDYEANLGADCIDCIPGEVIVVNAVSGANVTDLNDDQTLEKGEYYVIVLDESSECYIAHALVILE